MSDYIIKSYQPEFINLQVAIGEKIVENWKYIDQTSAERLRETYSQPDFDPETRLYCFIDEELVGFLTAKTIKTDEEEIGFIRFPFVLKDHITVTDLLMEKIIEVFQSKGIKRIQGVAGELWGESLKEGERWGFENIEDRASAYILDVDSVDIMEEDTSVVPFDFKTDPQKIAEIIHREYGTPVETIKTNYENLETNENILFIPVIKDGEELVALSMLFKDATPAKAIQAHSYVKVSKYYLPIQNSINKVCKEKGISQITIFFREPTFKFAKEYETAGFVYETKTVLLEKEI